MSKKYLIGIDVGTGSVRAGIFDQNGTLAGQSSHPIKMWRSRPDFVEQSSDDIWQACCKAVKEALGKAGVNPDHIRGIGFDATCSLVVLGENDTPLPVTPGGDKNQNIIVWMDHRAKKEAGEINKTGHQVLKYVGGVISPEMQTPKLLWLKRHHPETWKMAGRIGANVLTHMLGQSLEDISERIRLYREARREAGHEGPGHGVRQREDA
jgi:D-ribulokinase